MQPQLASTSSSQRTRLSPWCLVLCLAIVAGNLYLTFGLSRWRELFYFGETMLALLLVLVALIGLVKKRGPTLTELLLWCSLASVLPISSLQNGVIERRISEVGTETILRDARQLSAFATTSEKQPERFDPDNLLITDSLRALNPDRVEATAHNVRVVLTTGFGSEESIVIDTDPRIVAGPVQSKQPWRSWREDHWSVLQRPLAPGISYQQKRT